MKFERVVLIPQHGNGDSRSSVKNGMPFPPESGIEHSQGPRTTTVIGNGFVGGGDARVTPRRPIPMDNGTLCDHESPITIKSEEATPMGNGAGNNRNSWNRTMERSILQRNGIGQDDSKPAIPGNLIPCRNGVGESKTSWTPVTPEKLMNERSSNTVPFNIQEKQSEAKNWQDLTGMYMGLLQETKLDTNRVVTDINHTLPLPLPPPPPPPPPMVCINGNQKWVADTAKRKLNSMASPSPYWNRNSNQASNSLSFFNTYDPANWKCNDLEAIVGTKGRSSFVSSAIEGQNNGIRVSNWLLVRNPTTQVESKRKEVLQTTGDSSPAISKTLKEHVSSKNGDEQCINLKTPKKMSKPNDLTNGTSKATPVKRKYVKRKGVSEKTPVGSVGKRKYVRKKGIGCSGNQQESKVDDVAASAVETPAKSCKLNDTQEIEHVSSKNGDEQHINLNKTPKKTPKPIYLTNGTSKETRVKRKYVQKKGMSEKNPVGSVGKRKYVRKKGIDCSGNQQESKVDDVAASAVETPAKSCKLNDTQGFEHVSSKNGDERCINLNKIPKKRPKPNDLTNGNSKEAPAKRKYVKKKGVSEKTPVGSAGKRKYVRKKGIDCSGSQQESKVDDVAASDVETPAKSCKLNDTGMQVQSNKMASNLARSSRKHKQPTWMTDFIMK